MKSDTKKDDPIPNLCIFNGTMRNVIVSLKYRYIGMEEQEIIGPKMKIMVMMEACVEVRKLVNNNILIQIQL
jgi:hypothetical protein